MREINGIIYADNTSIPLRIIQAKALPDMMMLLTFSTNEQKLYDASQLLSYPAFAKLADENVFLTPILVDGVVTWDNENIDIAPETMYENSVTYNQSNIMTA